MEKRCKTCKHFINTYFGDTNCKKYSQIINNLLEENNKTWVGFIFKCKCPYFESKEKQEIIKYKRKPAIVEAIQLKKETIEDIKNFLQDCFLIFEENNNKLFVSIETPYGMIIAEESDYIIKEADGVYCVYKQDVFIKLHNKI